MHENSENVKEEGEGGQWRVVREIKFVGCIPLLWWSGNLQLRLWRAAIEAELISLRESFER